MAKMVKTEKYCHLSRGTNSGTTMEMPMAVRIITP